MSNGQAERMVRTLQREVEKMLIRIGNSWPEVLQAFLYGDRRRALASGPSLFESMYGVAPRIYFTDLVATDNPNIYDCAFQLQTLN